MNLKEFMRFDLKVHSPIHIGTREGTLRAMEFLCKDHKVHVVDEDRLAELLITHRALNRFMDEVQQGPLNLAVFLQRLNINLDQAIPQISKREIPGGQAGMQEFRPFIRDGQGNVYLPGTAIKGVLRTAVIYRLLANEGWRHRLVSLVKDNIPCAGDRKSKVEFSFELLQEKALQNFNLPPRQGTSVDPTTDLLRCLQVRDAYPVGEAKTWVVPILFLSKRKGGEFYFSTNKRTGDRLQVWIEALFQTTFRLELSWDRDLFQHFRKSNVGASFPMTGLQDLLDAVSEMNRDLWSYEQDEFYAPPATGESVSLEEALRARTGLSQDTDAVRAARTLRDWYGKRQGMLLRLGFGSGMLSTTVNLRLPMELRQKVRDRCGSGERRGEVAPKSRRVWVDSKGQWYPLGWASLTEV